VTAALILVFRETQFAGVKKLLKRSFDFNRVKSKLWYVLVYCGDHEGAKKTASVLIRDVGFNPLDLGPLSMARLTEPFSLLAAELAYNDSDNPALTYRFEPASTATTCRSLEMKKNVGNCARSY
jgi:hypothetical protein